jgi:hypothetical protein
VPRDQGPVPGKYAISINAATAEVNLPPEEVKTGLPGHVPPNRARDPVPEKYNAKTTLTAEVKQDGGNSFKFDLKTK